MNGPENVSNHQAIEHYGKVEVLGCVEHADDCSRQALCAVFENRLYRVREVLQ
jgi:hypothetical protein